MTKASPLFLDVNDSFPKMDIHLLSGDTLSLPEGFGDNYALMLIYRGDW